MTAVNPNEYTCAVCGETFTKIRSDAEAMDEARGNFGPVTPDECSLVCDDCYNSIMRWLDKVQRSN